MSGPGNKGGGYSRRSVAIGGGIAAALGIAALGVTVPSLLRTHYRKSPYDDLFAKLIDRDAAVKVGHGTMNGIKTYVEGPQWPEPAGFARELRAKFGQKTLADVTATDLKAGKVLEVQGWVMPQTLVMLCVLAAEQDR